MVKPAKNYILLSLFFFFLLLSGAYFFFFRDLVILAYKGDAPQWFGTFIDLLYPRFSIEKQRFELSFFLYKTDQILIRTVLIAVCLTILFWIKRPIRLIQSNSVNISVRHARILIFLFYCGLLYFTWNWIYAFDEIVLLAPFYKAVLLYQLLHLPILSLNIFYALYGLYIVSIILILMGSKKVILPILVALLSILFQGYFNSFEKIEHGQVTLTYVALLMPFLFHELNVTSQQINKEKGRLNSWTLFLIQFTIAGVYLLSGLEKLLTSGFQWASAGTFRTYVALHDQPWGIMIAENDLLAHLLPTLALVFQLTFILILFFPRWKYVWLIMGVFFHLGTKLLMDIGPYISSWFFVYIFFLDWDKLLIKGLSLMQRRHISNQNGA